MVPAFEGLQSSLKELQIEERNAEFIIQAGIEKLDNYSELTLKTPAYLLSVGEWLSYEAS
jgi:hypothetical protein